MDALPPIAESYGRVRPRFTGNGNRLMSNRELAAFPEVPCEIAGRGALSVRCSNPEHTLVALFGSFGMDFLLEV